LETTGRVVAPIRCDQPPAERAHAVLVHMQLGPVRIV
jgi:hypothetical protein